MQSIPREQFGQLLKKTKPADIAAYRLWLRIRELLATSPKDYPKDRDNILARSEFEGLRRHVAYARDDIGDENEQYTEKLWSDRESTWATFKDTMNKRNSAEQAKAKLATDAFDVCTAFGHEVALILFEIKDAWRLCGHPLARARLLLGVIEHEKLHARDAVLQSMWNGISVHPIEQSTGSSSSEQTSRGSVEMFETTPASLVGTSAEERTDTTPTDGSKRGLANDEGNTTPRSAKRFCSGDEATSMASYPSLDAQGQHPKGSPPIEAGRISHMNQTIVDRNFAPNFANNPTTHASLSDSTQQPMEFALQLSQTWNGCNLAQTPQSMLPPHREQSQALVHLVLSGHKPVSTTNDSELLYQALYPFYVLSLKLVGDLFD
jgi:hypothetical protein